MGQQTKCQAQLDSQQFEGLTLGGKDLGQNGATLAAKPGAPMYQFIPANHTQQKILTRTTNFSLRKQKVDRKDLHKFYQMNKIVPGGLLKLQQQSIAIKKAKSGVKPKTKNIEVQSHRKQCVVSILLKKHEQNVTVLGQPKSKTNEMPMKNSDRQETSPFIGQSQKAYKSNANDRAFANAATQSSTRSKNKDHDMVPCLPPQIQFSRTNNSWPCNQNESLSSLLDLESRIASMQKLLLQKCFSEPVK